MEKKCGVETIFTTNQKETKTHVCGYTVYSWIAFFFLQVFVDLNKVNELLIQYTLIGNISQMMHTVAGLTCFNASSLGFGGLHGFTKDSSIAHNNKPAS